MRKGADNAIARFMIDHRKDQAVDEYADNIIDNKHCVSRGDMPRRKASRRNDRTEPDRK